MRSNLKVSRKVLDFSRSLTYSTRKKMKKHTHAGCMEISWERFGELCRELALRIAANYYPDCVVGVSKGGLPLATVLASLFRADLYPIRLSYREKDEEMHDTPQWSVLPPDRVAKKKVLLVDDISVTAKTLSMAKDELRRMGVSEVKTVTLSVHHHSVKPDFFALETDALIIHPWDKWVLKEGRFKLHPEYAEN
jgi:hypoxanthine phosphoribosyltransferase